MVCTSYSEFSEVKVYCLLFVFFELWYALVVAVLHIAGSSLVFVVRAEEFERCNLVCEIKLFDVLVTIFLLDNADDFLARRNCLS